MKTRYLTWAERCCTRCNCSVVPVFSFLGIALVLVIAAHAAGVRQAALVFAVAVAVAVAVALAAAIAVRVARSRRPAAPSRARQPETARPVIRRAHAGLLGVPRPAGMCAEGCGRPAEAEVAGCPLCRPCADWLAAYLPADREAAGSLEMPPAGLLDGGFRPAGAEPVPSGPLPAELAEFEKDLQP